MRSTEPMAADPLLPNCVAAYTSDLSLLGTALAVHGRIHDDPGLTAVSLDHSLWFHRPFRADDWYLYEQEGSWAGQGLALCKGTMYDRAGGLLATIVQQGLAAYRSVER